MPVVKIFCQNNIEWRHERAKSVGASAIGTIMGFNKFQTAEQLAFRMRQELNGHFDYTQTTAMRRGHYYESGVAQYYADETHREIILASSAEYIVRRTDIPFMHASPDRIYWIDTRGPHHGKASESNKGVLECKTTRNSVNLSCPPIPWILQLQSQMGITGYHSGALAWDVLSKAEGFGYREFSFDHQLFDIIVKVCEEFWRESVIGGKTPLSHCDIIRRYPILTELNAARDNRPACSIGATCNISAPLRQNTHITLNWFGNLLTKIINS